MNHQNTRMGRSILAKVHQRNGEGFTLIEAVIAMGVFGFAIAMILGFFLRGTAHLRDVEDRGEVARLIPMIDGVLYGVGFDSAVNDGSPGVVDLTEGGAMVLVGNRNGSRVTLQGGVHGLPAADQYYLVRVERYTESGYRYGTDLRAVIVLKVRVTWPYRFPATSASGYVETAESDRRQYEFLSTVRP